MAKGEGKVRSKYMRQLAGEIITGEVAETYSNGHMERGKEWEADALAKYAFLNPGADIQRVGFVRNGNRGCSPDALVGADGLVEIKTMLPDLLIEEMLKPGFPSKHRAQAQGGLWVTGRQWVDLVLYHPKMPLVVRRGPRDHGFIASLAGEVEMFNRELAAMVEQIRGYRG